jgi:biopolymer transport protein ExbD
LTLLVESLGWTLLHFAWQGALIAATLYCLLAITRGASPGVRYLAACAALFGASAAVALTLAWQIDLAERRARPPVAVASNSAARLMAADRGAGPVMIDGAPGAPAVGNRTLIASETALAEDYRNRRGQASGRGPAAWPDRLRGWLPTIVGLWATGVGLLSLRLLALWRGIRRLRGAAREIDDPVWIARFADLHGRMGVSRAVRLLASTSATVPFVVGWLRPVVLVPAGLLAGLNAGELEAIFAHELAHIRRHDFLVNLLQNVVETLLFYHPAVWWISAQIRREREHCCDDAAAAACGGVLDYAKALVALEQLRPATGLMVAASGGSLLARIRRLAGFQDPGRSVWPLAALLLVLGTLGAILAVERLTVDQQNAEIDLPLDEAEAAAPEFPLRLRIRREPSGEVELDLNGQRTDEESLRRLVADVVQGGSDPPVLLACDTRVGYRDVMEVVDLLTALGLHKISFETSRGAAGAGETSDDKADRMSDDAAEATPGNDAAGAPMADERSSLSEPQGDRALPAEFGGDEIIARVGPEVILASDVLPDVNRHLQKVLEFNPQLRPADEVERARKLYMSKFLEHQIETKLVIVEGRRTLPKEAWGKIEKQFNEQFDKEYLKKMIDSEECRSRTELDAKLHEARTSLDTLRRQAFENSFAQHWMEEKVSVGREVTDERVRDFYQSHDDLKVVPFADVEAFIRKLIHEERGSARRQQYRTDLRKKTPVWNIFEDAASDSPSDDPKRPPRPVYPELYRGDVGDGPR